jgi:hypothetical protein
VNGCGFAAEKPGSGVGFRAIGAKAAENNFDLMNGKAEALPRGHCYIAGGDDVANHAAAVTD